MLPVFAPGTRRLKRWIDPDWADFWLSHVSRTIRISRTLARVEKIRQETADMKQFVLRPNANWRSFLPGQCVPVRVLIDGVRHERYYSLTGAPGEPTLSFAVKRQKGGRVSTFLHERVRVGDVVEIGEAAGDFVLPAAPAPLLFVAGGSGITPVFSLLRAAVAVDAAVDVTLLYYARGEADFAFRADIERLAGDAPGVRAHFVAETDGPSRQLSGRFTEAHLRRLVPDYANRLTYVCGPAGLMQAVEDHWRRHELLASLRQERFGTPKQTGKPATHAPVSFRRSQRTTVHTGSSLLETAEEAGLRPAYGCRMGICRTCVCTKVDGVVRDRVTGETDEADNTRIRLCVSEPVGPVTLDI